MARFAPLDYADANRIRTFRQPMSFDTPDGELWRLYSRSAKSSGRSVEIIIGYAEKAPWKMLMASREEVDTVDAKLEREADLLAENPPPKAAGARSSQKISADGFAFVDATTGEVVKWGPWVPMFLPKDKSLPQPGYRCYVANAELYLVRTDSNERLTAVTLVDVGSLWWLAVLSSLAFVITGGIARSLSRRYLRNSFAMTDVRVPSLEEACLSGESQTVEFKRALSQDEARSGNAEDELLKSIAAFANTNEGVIFVGVDDSGKIRGLGFDFTQRDRFGRKIGQLVRNRIKPIPPIEVTFEDVRGLVVAKIAVARGEAPAYMLGGAIYVRSGSSDVQAQPEDLRRLVAEYAF